MGVGVGWGEGEREREIREKGRLEENLGEWDG